MNDPVLEFNIRRLNTTGYIVIPKAIGDATVKDALDGFNRMLEKVEGGRHPHYQIHDDFLRFNVTGIEEIHGLNIMETGVESAMIRSEANRRAAEILRVKEAYNVFDRIQCTTKYSHSGIWHRDALVGDESHIESGLVLTDQDRFFVVPGSHKRGNTDEEDRLLKRSIRANLPGQERIVLKAGDLFFFRSAILHRGSSVGPRVYIFMRFGEESERQPHESKPRRLSFHRRVIAEVLHHALFFLPEDHPFFERFRWITPNLRLKERVTFKISPIQRYFGTVLLIFSFWIITIFTLWARSRK